MATLAQMRPPSRIMLRYSGVHVSGGHSGESSCVCPSFSLLLSFIRRSRSGGSCGRWPLLTPNPPMDRDGRREDTGRRVRKLQKRWSGLECNREI